MNSISQDFQDQFSALRREYAQTLLKEFCKIETLWLKLSQEGWDREELNQLHGLLHRLNGSASSYNFPDVSSIASSLEFFIKNIIDTSILPTLQQQQQVNLYIEALKHYCLQAPNYVEENQAPNSPQQSCVSQGREKSVYVVEDDEKLARLLALQIGQNGYQVYVFNSLKEFKEAMQCHIPSAIILDIMFPEGKGPNAISQLQQSGTFIVPVIFISSRNDMDARLQAIRAGGYAYFNKPVNVESLLAKLDTVTTPKAIEPYRIIIVDDDSNSSLYHAEILRESGMDPMTISDSMQVLEVMESFKPDLILMDFYMPRCSGRELTQIIRQEERYKSIPIMFLFSEDEIEKQSEAVGIGGDDFLIKPVFPDRLVRVVLTRIQRTRLGIREEEEKREFLEARVQNLQREMHDIRQIYSDGELKKGTILLGSRGRTYVISDVLGAGGSGVTYLARRNPEEDKVVIKTLLANSMNNVKTEMRFVQEARIILELQHENLVRGYDFHQGPIFNYIVMEFIEGQDVEHMIESQRYIMPLTATRIILGIARGLDYMTNRNLVHRDIKPSNIIVTHAGIPKLIDFGIVKFANQDCSLTTAGYVMGTADYMSPEQSYQSKVDIRSDIYSLGATFYHMVVGKPPFEGETVVQVIQQRLLNTPQASNARPDLPPAVSNVIEKMMQRHLENRYRTPAELIIDLETIIKDLTPPQKNH